VSGSFLREEVHASAFIQRSEEVVPRPGREVRRQSFPTPRTSKSFDIPEDAGRRVALVAKHTFGPYPARPGQRANVIVRDNAGNLIQCFGTESK
jgi:hypothetical protein